MAKKVSKAITLSPQIARFKVTQVEDGKKVYAHDIVSIVNKDKVTTHKMYYSNGSPWSTSTQGKLLLTVIDDGNGLSWQFERKVGDATLKKMDYSYAHYMHIMLKHIAKFDYNTLGFREQLKFKIKTVSIEI